MDEQDLCAAFGFGHDDVAAEGREGFGAGFVFYAEPIRQAFHGGVGCAFGGEARRGFERYAARLDELGLEAPSFDTVAGTP